MGNRGELAQVGDPLAFRLELTVRGADFLVLPLQLELLDAKLVDEALQLLGPRPRPRLPHPVSSMARRMSPGKPIWRSSRRAFRTSTLRPTPGKTWSSSKWCNCELVDTIVCRKA